MVNTNPILQALVAPDGVINQLEAVASGVVGASDRTFLANYQTKLSSERTNQTEDERFMSIFQRYWNWAKCKK